MFYIFVFALATASVNCEKTTDHESFLQLIEERSALAASTILDDRSVESMKSRAEKLGYDPNEVDDLLFRARKVLQDESHMARLREEAHKHESRMMLSNKTMLQVRETLNARATDLLSTLERTQKESGRNAQATVDHLVQGEDSHFGRFMRDAADVVRAAFEQQEAESRAAEERAFDAEPEGAPPQKLHHELKFELQGTQGAGCPADTWIRYIFADHLDTGFPVDFSNQFLMIGHEWKTSESFYTNLRLDKNGPFYRNMFAFSMPWTNPWASLPANTCSGLNAWSLTMYYGTQFPVCFNCGTNGGEFNEKSDQWWSVDVGAGWGNLQTNPSFESASLQWGVTYQNSWRHSDHKEQFNIHMRREKFAFESFAHKLNGNPQSLEDCENLDYLELHTCHPRRWQKLLAKRKDWMAYAKKEGIATRMDNGVEKKMGWAKEGWDAALGRDGVDAIAQLTNEVYRNKASDNRLNKKYSDSSTADLRVGTKTNTGAGSAHSHLTDLTLDTAYTGEKGFGFKADITQAERDKLVRLGVLNPEMGPAPKPKDWPR